RARRVSRRTDSVEIRVEANQILHFRWSAKVVQAPKESRDRFAIAPERRKEIDDALQPPELIGRSEVVIPEQPGRNVDHGAARLADSRRRASWRPPACQVQE